MLWAKLKPLLKAGKHAAVQARELWYTEEKKHLRPGHFWACELGDADGKGSPIIHTFTRKSEYFTLSDGRKVHCHACTAMLAPPHRHTHAAVRTPPRTYRLPCAAMHAPPHTHTTVVAGSR